MSLHSFHFALAAKIIRHIAVCRCDLMSSDICATLVLSSVPCLD